MKLPAPVVFRRVAQQVIRVGLGVGLCAVVIALEPKAATAGDGIVWPQQSEFGNSLSQPAKPSRIGTSPFRPDFVDWGAPVIPVVRLETVSGPTKYDAISPGPFQPEPQPDVPRPLPGDATADAASAGGGNNEEKLGKAPEDNRLLFLRQATVLLQPGHAQFDCGFDYAWQETNFPVVLPDGTVADERRRDRRIVSPLAFRCGVTKRMQAFLNMPVGFGLTELSNPEESRNDTVFGLGDISTGVNYLLRKGEGICPDVIATMGVTAPTGPFQFVSGLLNQATLGNGFWAINTDLLFVKTIDPAVVFYGIGYRHYFQRDFFGGLLAPGEELDYNFGVGLAINDSLTLSTIFLGAFRGDTRFNGANLPGTSQEPLSLRFALTAIASQCYIVEPFVRIGLTPDAPNADFGIILTRNF